MFNNLTLRVKLMVSFLAVGVIPFLIIGGYALYDASAALNKASFAQLESARSAKKSEVDLYFQEHKDSMIVLEETVSVLRKNAFAKLESMAELKRKEITTYLKERMDNVEVAAKNRSVVLTMYNVGRAFEKDKKTWATTIEKYTDWLVYYSKKHHFEDVHLIDAKGNIVFSLQAEVDFGKNVLGELKDTNISTCFKKCKQGQVNITDMAIYNTGEVAMFAGAPIEKDGEVIGALIFEFNIAEINETMQERTGQGKTGETYLVGADYRMRSDSYLDPQNRSVKKSLAGTIESNGIKTEATINGLKGNDGADVITDYRNLPVLSVWHAITVYGLNWVLIAEIDLEEAFIPKLNNGEDYLASFQDHFEYQDIYLLTPDGYCFYSVKKGSDYKTNLLTGKYRGSNMSEAINKLKSSKKLSFVDFKIYEPTKKPAAFYVTPLVHQGEVEVFVASSLAVNDINNMMQTREGMGKTGEAYLVGSDNFMRSDSYLDKNLTVENTFVKEQKTETEAIKLALQGETGSKIITDYRGAEVLSAYAPVSPTEGMTWAMLVEVDEAEAFASVAQIRLAMIVLGLIGIIAIIGVAFLISGQIGNPIMQVVTNLSAASEQVASASSQMSTSSQQISEGASEQASTLEEVSSSLEEMTSMTQQNADNSAEAEKLAMSARESAVAGKSKMDAMKEAMEEVQVSSDEMQKIIQNIEEIAFQTNMLALNAAVEAARAGEHGRGFAVVAEEVRNLARKSSDFAKTTSALVMENTQQIHESNEAAAKSLESFDEILEGSEKVSELVAEIAAASKEQAQGLNQVTLSVTEMDKVVQQNATSSEEQASVSEELNSQAGSLDQMVHRLADIIGSMDLAAKNQQQMMRKAAATPRSFQAAAPKMVRKEEKTPLRPEEVIPLEEDSFKDF